MGENGVKIDRGVVIECGGVWRGRQMMVFKGKRGYIEEMCGGEWSRE